MQVLALKLLKCSLWEEPGAPQLRIFWNKCLTKVILGRGGWRGFFVVKTLLNAYPQACLATCSFEERVHYSSQERVGVLPWLARMFADLGLPPWTPRIECLKIPSAEERGN